MTAIAYGAPSDVWELAAWVLVAVLILLGSGFYAGWMWATRRRRRARWAQQPDLPDATPYTFRETGEAPQGPRSGRSALTGKSCPGRHARPH